MNLGLNPKHYLALLLFVATASYLNAQLIVQKSSYFGITDQVNGDPLVDIAYDSIQQVKFDYRAFSRGESKSPVFACWKAGKAQLYNTTLRKFYPNVYDDIYFCHAGQEHDNLHEGLPKHYTYYAVDCVILKKDNLWGYISHEKKYGFHDDLKADDKFIIVEPQYTFLRYVEEELSYDSQRYERPFRLLSVSKGKGFGAIDFVSGEEIYPFILPYPIRSCNSRYAETGLEFFDSKPEFIRYLKAANSFDPDTMLIANLNGKKPNFEVYGVNDFELLNEFGKTIIRQTFEKGDSLKILSRNFETGETDFTLTIPGNKADFKIYHVQPNILEVWTYNTERKKPSICLYNIASGAIMLFYEKKGLMPRELGGGFFFIPKENEIMVYDPHENYIGKLIGEGSSQQMVWDKKVYLPKEKKK